MAIARRALKLIDVKYEVLPHVIDVVEAMRPDAPLLHDDLYTAGVEPKPEKPSNIAKRVETIEGMARGETLHPLQQRFLEHAALQCGICTPGFLVASKALLERTPNPTEHEIRFWLAGNLCRCTGYDKIVSAVMDAATTMRKG